MNIIIYSTSAKKNQTEGMHQMWRWRIVSFFFLASMYSHMFVSKRCTAGRVSCFRDDWPPKDAWCVMFTWLQLKLVVHTRQLMRLRIRPHNKRTAPEFNCLGENTLKVKIMVTMATALDCCMCLMHACQNNFSPTHIRNIYSKSTTHFWAATHQLTMCALGICSELPHGTDWTTMCFKNYF